MIPKFPEFTKLDLLLGDEINNFFRRFPAYSEFGFTNMFAWDTVKPVMVSILNENLIIKFVDFSTDEYYLTLIGSNDVAPTIKTLLSYAKENNYQPILQTIPEHVITEIMGSNDFEIEEELHNNDYILSIPTLVKLEGKVYEHKRHKINQFNKTYDDRAEFKHLDLKDEVVVKDISSVMQSWVPNNPHSNKEVIIELTAILRSIKHHEKLNIEAYGVFIDGALEGFTLIEKVHGKMVIGHFEKCNKQHIGIYEFMNHSLAEHLLIEGYEFLNICQDLGYEGLRSSKMSYGPVTFHRKYSLKEANAIHSGTRQKVPA